MVTAASLEVCPYDFHEGPNSNPVSVLEYTDLIAKMAALPGLACWWSAKYLVQNNKAGLGKAVFQNLSGYVTKSLNVNQIRVLVPVQPVRKTLRGYERRAERMGLKDFNRLFGGENYSARWIHQTPDRTATDPVIIYMHGGGYALKLGPPQVEYIIWFARKFADKRVSVLLLDYTVSKVGRYPMQLREASALYKELAESCENIWLMGDSCGGHLAISVISHMNDPVPSVPVLECVQPTGLILLSPWVCIDTKHGESFQTKAQCDIINKTRLDQMQEMFCDECYLEDPNVNFILRENADFWKKVLPAQTVAVWGGDESLRDSIVQWTKNAGVERAFEEPYGVHDAMLNGTDGESTKYLVEVVSSWLK